MNIPGLFNRTIFFSLIFLLIFFSAAGAQSGLVLNTANDPPNATEDHRGICDRVLTEAFRRMGMPLKIVQLPSERALVNADEGIEDGNFARVEGLEGQYPNLIRVPEEITRFEFVAFSRGHKFRTENWDSLKPYNVGIITGWKILESSITGVKSLTRVADETTLFGLLKQGRVDLVVYDLRQGRLMLNKLKMDDANILVPPLAVKGMYPYLNKKHGALVPKLADTLLGMKKDGTYQKIVSEVLREFSLRK